MSFNAHYVRVSHDQPCPVCGRPDWCVVHRNGRKCICSRTPSGKPAGDAGWIHYLPDGAVTPKTTSMAAKPKAYLSVQQVEAYLASAYCPLSDALLGKQAQVLRLSAPSVWELHSGYDAEKAVLAFPMFNESRQPVGVRFRRRDGRKWSLKGGREGVFMSRGFNPARPVFIAEGPTDAASLVEAGLRNALGRPNCSGGVAIIQGLLKNSPRTPVVVLADPDEPGIAGAERLILSLPNPCVVLSGVSDVRNYVTKFRQRSDSATAIMEVLAGYRQGEWKATAYNLSGKCFDFSLIQRSMKC